MNNGNQDKNKSSLRSARKEANQKKYAARTWDRPISSRNVDLERVDKICEDIRLCGRATVRPKEHAHTHTKAQKVRIHKYKAVDKKIRPVAAVMPEDVKVQRTFPEDPLKNLPVLPFKAPEFVPTQKLTQERMDGLGIEANSDMTEEEKRLLKYILVLNERSIAFDDPERGTFRRDYFSDYQIPVVEHEPWVDKNIPLPPGNRDKIIKALKEKLDAGVYEKAQSSYRSRWFCVGKKDGGIRLVHDLQKLNGVTIRDTGVPPILDEFVEAYAGRSVYSVLDMYWGFYARVIDPRSRDMTAFQTPLGVLRITSLPMGFTNSPAEFQACMVFILEDEMPEVAGVFIDDIPIKGPINRYLNKDGVEETMPENQGIRRFMWEHLNDLHRILHRIGEAGGTVSGKKMQLCRREVEIVGQKCSREGRLPTDTRAQRVKDWPPPLNVSEVRGFLGLCGTVRIWIKDFSKIARPMVILTRKEAEFVWGESQQKAFQILKDRVGSAPALKPIDYQCGRPVILSVDSSIYGIGFVLAQLDDKGRRTPARYGSLPISKVVAGYAQSKLELYGLFRALRQFRIYLIGAPRLIVEMDASCIKGMINNPDSQASQPINRWIRNILMFDFELLHIPGAKHKAPDALSRRRYTKADIIQHPKRWISDEETSGEAEQPPKRIRIRMAAGRVGRRGRDKEQELNDIMDFLETFRAPKANARERKRFLKNAARHYRQEDRLYRRHKSGNNQRVLLTGGERRRVIGELHESQGHRGEWAMWEAVRLRFYWPGMREEIAKYVKSCHTCQVRSTKKMHIRPTISQPRALFSKVYLDVMRMPLAQKYQWLVACRDDLSGASESRALVSDTGRALASFFLEQVIFRYGTVGEVVTDNGPSLEGEFTKIVQKYNIYRIKISPYNSQANGVVERGHFTIRETLVKLCDGHLSRWPKLLSAAMFADRITIRRATGFSPYYLLHGVHPMLPCDLAEITFMAPQFKDPMTDEELLAARIRQIAKMPEDVARARETLYKSRFQSAQKFEEKFGRRIRRVAYNPGDLVLVRNTPNENTVSINKKVLNRYMGPYCVVRETRGKAYVLKEMNGNILKSTVAAFRLIPYVNREQLDGWARLIEAWEEKHTEQERESGSTSGTGETRNHEGQDSDSA